MIRLVQDELIDLGSVARKFGVTYQTATNWRRKGLAARKLGSRWYTTEEALEAFSRESTAEVVEVEPQPAATHRLALEEARRTLKELHGIG